MAGKIPTGVLERLAGMVKYSTPHGYSVPEQDAVRELWTRHGDLRDEIQKGIPRSKFDKGFRTPEYAQQSLIMSNLSGAIRAKRYDDKLLRYLELLSEKDPGRVAGNATIYPPGYFQGTPYEDSVYIQGIGSMEPGAGRAVLEALKGHYPKERWFLESLEDHGTPEWYLRRGFKPADDTPMSGSLPNFELERGEMLKAEGGSVENKTMDKEQLKKLLQAKLKREELLEKGGDAVRKAAYKAVEGGYSNDYGPVIGASEKLRTERDDIAETIALLRREAQEEEKMAPLREQARTWTYSGEPYGQTGPAMPEFGPHELRANPLTPREPQESWQKWRTSKDEADRATGDKSMLGALRQFYLSQTEPDKYGDKFMSEGDMTGLGLSIAPLLAAPGLLMGNSVRAALGSGLASEVVPGVLGDHDAGDVAANTLLGGAIQKGLNTVFRPGTMNATDDFLRNPRAAGDRFRQAMTRPRELPPLYDMPRLPAPAQAAPDPSAGWVERMKEISRDMDEINAPRKPVRPGAGINPEELERMQPTLRDVAEIVARLKEGPRKAKPEYKMLDPFGRMVDEVPVDFRLGGSI